MALIIYVSLFLLFLFLGTYFAKTKDIRLFYTAIAVLPIISSLTALHTKFQVNVYYAFIIFPVLLFILNNLRKNTVSKLVASTSLIGFSFVFIYFIYTLLIRFYNIDAINIFKDLKPIFFLLLGFVFLKILREHQFNWEGGFARKILKYNFYASIFWFLILKNTSIIGNVSSDVFYNMSEIRYAALSTTFVMIYFIASLASKKSFSKWDIVYVLIPIFLTGNRTTFVVLGGIFLINMFLSVNNVNLFFKRGLLFFSSVTVLVLGVFKFSDTLRERILTLLDFDLLAEQLTEHRFAPFFDKLSTFEWYHYVFGKGIGETIFIPWFVYRENIENDNIYMDNIYMTLFIKYGIFFLLPLFLIYFFINKTNTNKRFKILMIFYFAGMGLTTAFMYQSKFLFILLILASFKFESRNKELSSFTV